MCTAGPNVKKMKRIARLLLLFLCSFAAGVCVSPVFMTDEEPVSEPTPTPIKHYRDRYGAVIKRTV